MLLKPILCIDFRHCCHTRTGYHRIWNYLQVIYCFVRIFALKVSQFTYSNTVSLCLLLSSGSHDSLLSASYFCKKGFKSAGNVPYPTAFYTKTCGWDEQWADSDPAGDAVSDPCNIGKYRISRIYTHVALLFPINH